MLGVSKTLHRSITQLRLNHVLNTVAVFIRQLHDTTGTREAILLRPSPMSMRSVRHPVVA
jgi:hypothetical protein